MIKLLMLKQKIIHHLYSKTLILAGLVLVITSSGIGIFRASAVSCSSSADCQRQIDSLNAQNSQAQQSVDALQAQASSYQDAVDRLSSQINIIQQQIVASQNQETALRAQIAEAQAQLEQEKKTLGEDIKAIYLEGNVSTLEILASSNNISDYVDKQTYRTSVQNKIKASVDKVTALKQQLQEQISQVEQLLKTQQDQRQKLAADENQQSQLLSYNQNQQSQYNQQIQANKSALADLYKKQAAIIAASFGGGFHYGGTGGYPWADAQPLGPIYSWGYSGGGEYDPAGWAYRNCTSYAFWRLAQTTGITLTWNYFPATYNSGGRIKYSVLGGDFQNLGYRVDHDPTGEAVLAVNTSPYGYFGHIMYVESVVGGQAIVSQYNGAGDGRFSTGTLSVSDDIWFVHVR